jgi:hypothetical protein
VAVDDLEGVAVVDPEIVEVDDLESVPIGDEDGVSSKDLDKALILLIQTSSW